MSVNLSKGVVYLAEFDVATGFPKGGFFDMGECDSLSLLFEQQRAQKFSNRSCGSVLVADVRTRLTTQARLRPAENTAKNIQTFLQGTGVSVAATAITGETIPGTNPLPSVGDFLFTKHGFSAFTALKDSAGSPATLVLNTDYKVIDADGGIIQIIASLSGKTAPLKADYTPKAHTVNKLLAASEKDWVLRYSGVNCVTNEHENWEVYQVRMSLPSEWQILGDQEFAQYEITSPMLYNSLRAADGSGLYGGYARQMTL